jgi:hypothetical protein
MDRVAACPDGREVLHTPWGILGGVGSVRPPAPARIPDLRRGFVIGRRRGAGIIR